MTLFTRIVVWCDYLAGQLSVAEIDERFYEGVYEHTKALVMLRNIGGDDKAKVTIERMERTTDPEVVAAREQLDVAYAKRKILATMFGNSDRDAALVSRELTRRVGSGPRARREEKWAP